MVARYTPTPGDATIVFRGRYGRGDPVSYLFHGVVRGIEISCYLDLLYGTCLRPR